MYMWQMLSLIINIDYTFISEVKAFIDHTELD